MTALEKRIEAWQWLQQQFPAAFPKQPIPLKIGIHEDMFALALADMPGIMWIKRALRYYVSSPRYLREMVAGKARINLQGEQVGAVSEQEALHAKERLLSYRKKKEKQISQTQEPTPVKEVQSEEITPVFGRRLALKKSKETDAAD